MGSNRTTFEKQQRDRAKKAKAAAKRDKRQGREGEEAYRRPAPPTFADRQTDAPTSVASIEGEVTAEKLLALVENLHKRFEDGEISFEEFEEEKAELFALLNVD